MTELNGQKCYDFADFRLIPGEGLLLRDGEPVTISPKVFETLVYLVERRGHLVQKAELMDKIWADAFVEENAVSKSVWSIRNVLGKDPKDPRFIQTVPKRGYRFVGEVTEHNGDLNETSSPDDGPSLTVEMPLAAPRKSRFAIIAALAVGVMALSLGIYAYRGWFMPQVDIRSITVLPLENSTVNPSDQYFVAGVTDALIADLSKISDLRLIALPTDLREPGPRDFTETGRRLNVDGLLTGSVSRFDDRIRVVIELIHASDGRNVWSRSYEREVRDVQRLHLDIARDIVQELRVALSPNDAERLTGIRPVAPEAYDEYLRGRFYLNLQNPKDQDTAIAALEKAVHIDPSYAAAFAELAQAYTWKQFSFARNEKGLAEKAVVAMEKALALDPGDAAAYLARGRVLWTPWNNFPHEKAIVAYRKAIELNPNLAEARNQLAIVYCHVGLLDEALVEAREGVKLDPTSNLLQLRIGQTLNSQMKFEEALLVLTKIPVKVHPSMVIHQTAWALFNLGRKNEALEMVDQAMREHRDEGGTFAAMKAVIEASQGNIINSEQLIAEVIEKGNGYGHFHHTAYTIAAAYALMNKRDQAIYWLDQAAKTGFPCYPSFENDPNLNSLRNDPRFSAFLKEVKSEWEHYKSL